MPHTEALEKNKNMQKLFIGFVIFISLLLVLNYSLLKSLNVYQATNQNNAIVRIENQHRDSKLEYIDIYINTETSVNTMQIDLEFDPAVLEVKDILFSDEYNDLILAHSYSNEYGTINIISGMTYPLPSPNGKFATLVALKKSPTAEVKINLISTSATYQYNGDGSKINLISDDPEIVVE